MGLAATTSQMSDTIKSLIYIDFLLINGYEVANQRQKSVFTA